MKNSTFLKTSAAPLALGLALVATPSFAQDDSAATGADEGGSPIIVTGSRIARPDLSSVSPVTVVDAEQIELTGTVTLETLLNDLPNVIPGNNRTSNNAGGFPFSTLDLRGLGPGRTLILVDGERLPPSSASGVVDIAQIPVGLIERIDVVTGGATAVYGSDAIAGVVNFILNDDFEGVELTGQVGVAEVGVGFNYNVSGLIGGNFGDGRGNIAVFGSYFEREGVSQNRFDYSRVSAAVCANAAVDFLSVCDEASDVPAGGSVFSAGGSATPPWGRIVNSAINPFQGLSTQPLLTPNFTNVNTDCNAATPNVAAVNTGNLAFNQFTGQLQPYRQAGLCGIPTGDSSRYNFAPDNFLSVPYDRLNISVLGHYDFSDRTTLRVFAAYTNTNQSVQLAPSPAAAATGFQIDPTIATTLPDDLRAALATRPNPNAPFLYEYRFSSVGQRAGNTEIQSVNGRAFLEHDFGGEGNWRISAGAGFGRVDLVSTSLNNVSRSRIESGVNGCRNAAGTVNGPGVPFGCVPVDIFGPNTLSAAAVDYIRINATDVNQFTQTRVSANVTGNLVELPAGPVGLAFGAEQRTDRVDNRPDVTKVSGDLIGFNQEQPISGEIVAREVYGEIRVPLLGGGSGFPDLLAVEAGARYSDYSTLDDGLFNYKVAVEFAPVNWLRFRGAFNSAARAPSAFELFQAGNQGFPSYTDPCNANRPGGALAGRCNTDIPAVARPTFQQTNSQVQALAFGNPDLQEEEAETWTAGVVIQPDFVPIGRMSLTVDYYDITLEKAVQGLGAGFFLNACYVSNDPTACARITRDPASGQVTNVNTTVRNSPDVGGPTELSGIDASLNWVFPISEVLGGNSETNIRISNLFSYAMDYKVGGTEFVGIAASGLGGVTSKYANTLTVAVETESFTIQTRWVYKSGGEDDTFGLDDDGKGFSARIPDLNTVDLSARWDVNERFSLTGIVNNLFDKYPPQTVGGTFEQANTNASFFSPYILGRSYSMQGRVRF